MASSSSAATLRPIHPFPARMAPDLVLKKLVEIGDGGRVLDPMAGSGVVLRHAIERGHCALGYDLDPLAVLMARVWTTPICEKNLDDWTKRVQSRVAATSQDGVELHWIDSDDETRVFIDYWFGKSQQAELRRIASVLSVFGRGQGERDAASLDLLRLALSRIIVTKEPCASLARDTSHSRPHKVLKESTFRVLPAFWRSIRALRKWLTDCPPEGRAQVQPGDARNLASVDNGSIDAVITSPPYLNAIDYLRGHRLSLVWLGHGLRQLREIRAESIGAERGPADSTVCGLFGSIRMAMGRVEQLPNRYFMMIERYAEDLYRMISEIRRVLRPGGVATLVVGNSCLRGTFIDNAAAVFEAGKMIGLERVGVSVRELPDRRRYLPFTKEGQLARRMRTETICSFVR